MQLQPTEAWQILTHSFPRSTMETLRGIINMYRSEQRLPRVTYKNLPVQEVINTLRSVAHTTDKESAFNSEDTLEGNLTKRTGSVLPDSMDEANVMRAKIFEVYNACSDEVKANFTKILSEIKLWVKGLKSASSDTAFQKYITNKFRHHMEYGLHDEVTTEFDDIGDRILQWGYQRDKLRAEIKQNFPQLLILLLQAQPPLLQLLLKNLCPVVIKGINLI